MRCLAADNTSDVNCHRERDGDGGGISWEAWSDPTLSPSGHPCLVRGFSCMCSPRKTLLNPDTLFSLLNCPLSLCAELCKGFVLCLTPATAAPKS